MTLQEAHEIQRRELISLRAENKRLQKQTSGLFPVEEKETLERHIRHLEQVIKTNDRRHESARKYWKLTGRRCRDLEIENLNLKEQVSLLSAENDSACGLKEQRLKYLCLMEQTRSWRRG